MVQNLPPSIVNPSLVQGSSTIVEESELQVGAKRPIELVDAIIARVACGDPSPHNALSILQTPTHITHMVIEDGINI
jgi:hypothetical protein